MKQLREQVAQAVQEAAKQQPAVVGAGASA
jgi:hypothetical protein